MSDRWENSLDHFPGCLDLHWGPMIWLEESYGTQSDLPCLSPALRSIQACQNTQRCPRVPSSQLLEHGTLRSSCFPPRYWCPVKGSRLENMKGNFIHASAKENRSLMAVLPLSWRNVIDWSSVKRSFQILRPRCSGTVRFLRSRRMERSTWCSPSSRILILFFTMPRKPWEGRTNIRRNH